MRGEMDYCDKCQKYEYVIWKEAELRWFCQTCGWQYPSYSDSYR